jgi:type IV secretory pathway VirB6-like protein
LYVKSNKAFAEITEKGGWRNMWLLAMGIIGYIINTIMVAVIFFLIITTKVALSVLLVLAPFIIPLYLFPGQPRDLCTGWIRTVLTFMFIPILLYSACGLFVDVLEQHIDEISKDAASTESVFAYATITIICIMFVQQIPSLAYGITSGASASDAGAGMSRWALNKSKLAAFAGLRFGYNKGKSGVKWGYRKLKGYLGGRREENNKPADPSNPLA